MPELLRAFDADGRLVKTTERKLLEAELREQYLRDGSVSLAVEAIHLLLQRSDGRIRIVRRSPTKSENAGRFDKTVGGHVAAGEPFVATLQREVAEEVGAQLLPVDVQDYPAAVASSDLSRVAVVRPIYFDPWWKSIRIGRDGERWERRVRACGYAGVYDGPFAFEDGEADAEQALGLVELRGRIERDPDSFTHDLACIVCDYAAFFRERA